MTDLEISWRGDFDNDSLNALHAEAFDHPLFDDDWASLVRRHSLGWVTAHDAGRLVGFVNVPWDGAMHAWLQDVIVAIPRRRQGVARSLVAVAVDGARAAGCEWIHVDFDDDLAPFYLDACGFTPTSAGLIQL